jgi:hypothetical protein
MKTSMETGPKCLSERADADWRLVGFGCAPEGPIRRRRDVTCPVATGRCDDPPMLTVVGEVSKGGAGITQT